MEIIQPNLKCKIDFVTKTCKPTATSGVLVWTLAVRRLKVRGSNVSGLLFVVTADKLPFWFQKNKINFGVTVKLIWIHLLE